ncbi:MAG: tRNA (adenosine(37)-N6)-threonylcarbamoyltransferase complex ATPase subunit type 1 TsaE [Puniceicoccales bacterium]|jgi:tRNA threonylcarbamoyladenosine biosynthesis protein TsaE|nr:tRNA (adenosine(37)-N6)-threonylcarbamoyltransferase complex ATPase subunit type 1 TsaE [Puniceicoccales bacterium]
MGTNGNTSTGGGDAASELARWRRGITAANAAETEALGGQLAALLPPNTALALHGALGAGKTTFARGFVRALGATSAVASPTFAIFAVHEAPARQIIHADAYRLASPAEADSLMLWDVLREPWTLLVEWPERLGEYLPDGAWHLWIEDAPPVAEVPPVADAPPVRARRLRLENAP